MPKTIDDLLDAAQALMLERGFDATSMAQVRQRARVSNGSLFHHFPSKLALVRGVYARALSDYHASLLEGLGSSVTAQAGVEGLVRRHVAWVLRAPGAARVLSELRAFTHAPGESPVWAAPNRAGFAALQGWISRQVTAGELRALPFEVWLALVFAPVLQLTSAWARAARPAVSRSVRDALASAAWNAVRAPPAHRRTR